MKLLKRLSLVLLTCAILCTGLLASGCGSGNAGGNVEYTVTVKNGLGEAYSSGIVVRFMQGGEQAALQACDENGVAAKTLPAGDYDVELKFSGDAEGYYYEPASVSAKEPKAEVILAQKPVGEPQILYVGSGEYEAYDLTEGCSYVDLSSDGRSYFTFTPTQAGTYEFSVIGSDKTEIGYYGAPHFIQENNLVEVEDNAFTISVTAGMIGSEGGGTSTYVIGVDALEDTKNCVVGIQRIGEAEWSIEDEPWEIYEKTTELSAYTLPEGAELGEFDLMAASDAYELVYNEADGFYHLDSEDGPLVLVRLTEDCEYIACFYTMLDRSGVSEYIYDDDGEFEKKISYSECLLEYCEYADEAEGVYPLTEDLKHIIQRRGEYVGWWDDESSGYIFKNADGTIIPGINSDIAWLMMCCYIK